MEIIEKKKRIILNVYIDRYLENLLKINNDIFLFQKNLK